MIAAIRRRSARLWRSGSLRQSALGFTLQIAGKALAMLVVLMLTRALDPADYGRFAYARSWVFLAGPLATLGLGYAAHRFVPGYLARGDYALATGYVLLAAGGAAAMALPAMAGLALVTGAMALGVLPVALMVTLRPPMQALGLAGLSFAPLLTLAPLLQALGLAGLAAADALTYSAAIAVFLSALFVAALVQVGGLALAWVRRAGVDRPQLKPRAWFGVAGPLTVSSLAMVIYQQADLLVVGATRPAEEAALYSLGLALALLLSVVATSVSAVYVPRLARAVDSGDTDALQQLARQSALAYALPVAAGLAGFAVLGPAILPMFGAFYSQAFAVLMLLGAAELVLALSEPAGQMLNLTGRHRHNAALVCCGAAINLVLTLILVPRFGFVAAAAVTLGVASLWSLARLLLLRRCCGLWVGIAATVRSHVQP